MALSGLLWSCENWVAELLRYGWVWSCLGRELRSVLMVADNWCWRMVTDDLFYHVRCLSYSILAREDRWFQRGVKEAIYVPGQLHHYLHLNNSVSQLSHDHNDTPSTTSQQMWQPELPTCLMNWWSPLDDDWNLLSLKKNKLACPAAFTQCFNTLHQNFPLCSIRLVRMLNIWGFYFHATDLLILFTAVVGPMSLLACFYFNSG